MFGISETMNCEKKKEKANAILSSSFLSAIPGGEYNSLPLYATEIQS